MDVISRWVAPLYDTSQSRAGYVFRAFVISIVPAIVVTVLVSLISPNEYAPTLGDESLAMLFIGVVVFSPVVETLVMYPIIYLLERVSRAHHMSVVVGSALFWAILHSMVAPLWGLSIFWSFVVFSICFVEWKRLSLGNALLMTALVHGLQNLFAFAMILIELALAG